MSTTTNPAEIDVFAWRKAARQRAWICPGAGFSAMGNRTLGKLSFVSGIGTFIAAIGAALWPSVATLWITIGLLLTSAFFWVWELVVTYTAWPTPTSTMPVGRMHWVGAALTWICIGGFSAAVVSSYRIVDMQDEGMAPTISHDERFLYHRRVDTDRLVKDALIVFQLPSESRIATPGSLKVGRILAMPGDKLHQFRGFYYINDKIDKQKNYDREDQSLIALRLPGKDTPLTVPEGSYYIRQDSTELGIDSQYFHWVKRDQIVSTRLYQIDRRPFLKRIE